MKYLKHVLLLPGSVWLLLASCTKSSTATSASDSSGNWIKRSEFDGNARTEAVAFTIGDTAYIGTGYDGTLRYADFWAYDPVKNFWVQRAMFPGKPRNSAVGFSVGSKGYIATGYDGVNRLSDNWEYDPATNSWQQKADFAGTARYDAVGFGINGNGYITTGFDGGYTKDLWQFTPNGGAGTWAQLPSFGGSKRSDAIVWVYNNKAYVVTGINNGQTVNDFWVFDPAAAAGNNWTQLRSITNVSTDTYDDDYTDIVRSNAVGFVIGNKGYLAVGENGSYVKKTWEYDFATDLWARKTTYERAERSGAVGFTVKGRGFVGTGRNATYYFDDLDEFRPDQTYDAND